MARPNSAILALTLGFMLLFSPAETQSADKTIGQFNGLVLKRKYQKSAAMLVAPARAGNASAQYRLGVLYRLGIGVPRDPAQASAWLNRAAGNGSKPATLLLKALSVPRVAETSGINPPVLNKQRSQVPNIDVEAQDKAGNTWFTRAIARGQLRPIMPYLSPAVLNTAVSGARDPAILTASRLGQTEAVLVLLSAGATVNEVDKSGRTPLMLAAGHGNAVLVEKLIAAGADFNRADDGGATALHYALRRCNEEAAVVLLEHSIPARSDNAGNSPLHEALRHCPNAVLVTELAARQDINAADAAGRTALWYAAAGQPEIVKVLLQYKARTDITDTEGFAPLHIAAKRSQVTALEALLKAGAGIAAANGFGDTALMIAAAQNCAMCVERLTRDKHNLNTANIFGDTALIAAARHGSVESIKYLVSAGAQTDQRNARRETALIIAERRQDKVMIELLQH